MFAIKDTKKPDYGRFKKLGLYVSALAFTGYLLWGIGVTTKGIISDMDFSGLIYDSGRKIEEKTNIDIEKIWKTIGFDFRNYEYNQIAKEPSVLFPPLTSEKIDSMTKVLGPQIKQYEHELKALADSLGIDTTEFDHYNSFPDL